jgi:type IV pilus assembly protein PilB
MVSPDGVKTQPGESVCTGKFSFSPKIGRREVEESMDDKTIIQGTIQTGDILGFDDMDENQVASGMVRSSWLEKLSRMRLLGELLLKHDKISNKQLKEALELSSERKVRIGEVLQSLGYLNEVDILEVIGQELDMKIIPTLDIKFLEKNGFDYNFFSKFSMEAIDRLNILPLKLDVNQVPGKTSMVWCFYFIVNDPWQYPDIMRIAEDFVRKERFSTGPSAIIPLDGMGGNIDEDIDIRIEIIGYLAKKTDISDVFGEIEGRTSAMTSLAGTSPEDGEEIVARTIRDIISSAIACRATDIHITPLHKNGGLWVRFRIDGELVDHIRNGRYETREYNTFLNKALIMSRIDHTEKRRPQSGSLQFNYNRELFDIRVETIPTAMSSVDSDGRGLDGSKILFRILYKEAGLNVNDLGFSPDDLMLIKKMYTKPSGVMLVTGPTSSGKTTTIYSIIKGLDASKQSVYTVEDPVEYFLDGATQISVSEKEGRSFAAVLKSLMRLDPNVVFMGEMRDPESAKTAMQIANTGHSVFSTLHTNSAYTAPQRLTSIGVEPYLIIGNLNGVIAQRLVKANCKNCMEEYVPSERIITTLGIPRDRKYYHGSGMVDGKPCPVCGGLGTKGRLGIFEVAPLCEYEGWEKYLDEPFKLRNFFKERGHGDLLDDAKRKMFQGLISPDALLGVLARMEVVLEEDLKQQGQI